MKRLGLGAVLAAGLVLGAVAPTARAQSGGIARIERLPAAPALTAAADTPPSPRPTSAREQASGSRRLDGARDGSGWWRLDPEPPAGKRLLLVYNPYSARVTVRTPPDYRPRTQTVFDRDLDPRHSRHALVFPIIAPGPVYVGVEGARYPLQIAVRAAGEYAAADLRHVSALFATTGVLIGVSLVALLFWIMLRDRVYLLYAVAMAAQLLYVLCAYGAAYALPGLRLLAGFGAAGIWFVATVSTVVTVFFLVDFGELRLRVPRLSRALLWIGAWLPIALLVLLVSPWPADKGWFPISGNLLLMAANLLALIALTTAWLRGGRHAGFVLIAWLPLVIMSTARATQLSAGAPLSPWLEYGLPVTLAYSAVVLVLGLADRMLAFRRERDAAQEFAERDPLTATYNRAGIERRLDWAIARARRERQPLSVLFLDLDYFKQINDGHGHAVGDACLRAVVAAVAQELRFGDHLGRLGGEEFLLVLPNSDRERALAIAERIRRGVQQRCEHVDGAPVALTVSIGATECADADAATTVITRADGAMYAAKRAGRNRVVALDAAAASVSDP